MTAQIIRGSEVTRPTPEALSSTILDHATVVNLTDHFGLRNNEGMWPSYNCLDLFIPTPMCPEPLLSETGEYKDFKVAEWQGAFEFAVYGGVKCSAVGLDRADMVTETARVFERGEAKGVEQAIREIRLLAPEPGSDEAPLWEPAEDITPVAGVNLQQAIALLEGHAAMNYAGVPTLHLPRAAVLLGFGQGIITERDGKFFTKTGAKVAAGGGYDDPEALTSGEWLLFATGEVYIERSDKIEQQAYTIPGDGSGTGSDENGLGDNTVIALNERMYRVAIDCYAAMITATVWS